MNNKTVKRNKRIPILVTDEEAEMIKGRAENLKMNISSYVRERALAEDNAAIGLNTYAVDKLKEQVIRVKACIDIYMGSGGKNATLKKKAEEELTELYYEILMLEEGE